MSIDTTSQILKTFVKCLYKCEAICDMTVQMSEYYLMGKYSLIGFRKLILYGIIDGGYVQTDNLSFLSVFLLLSINRLTIKEFLRI